MLYEVITRVMPEVNLRQAMVVEGSTPLVNLRGTAPGILLPLLRIAERDPGATLVVLPSDHHVDA